MIWYGLEPIVAEYPDRGAQALKSSRIPLIREHIAQRAMALRGDVSFLGSLVQLLPSMDPDRQADALRGMKKALAGRRPPKPPEGWAETRKKLVESKNTEVRQHALVLSGIFADPKALAMLRKYAGDAKEETPMHQTALQTLIEVKADGVPALLRELLTDPKMRTPAIRGLAAVKDAEAHAAHSRPLSEAFRG